jgi:ELWxxDGT repeat protein
MARRRCGKNSVRRDYQRWLPKLEALEDKLLPSSMGLAPYLVADINPGAASSQPGLEINLNGTLFFCASTGIPTLWESNGVAAGTTQVLDTVSPSHSFVYSPTSSP